MAKRATKTKTKTKKIYAGPTAAWRLPLFIEASLDAVKAKVVECSTCPVFLLCETGTGGTGWVCPKCNATGVYVDQPENDKAPEDVLVVDCGNHKFDVRAESKRISECALCSGGIMELEILAKTTKNHYIATAYAKVAVETRHAHLKAAHDKWKKHHAATLALRASGGILL